MGLLSPFRKRPVPIKKGVKAGRGRSSGPTGQGQNGVCRVNAESVLDVITHNELLFSRVA
jgi:hypothetical protein